MTVDRALLRSTLLLALFVAFAAGQAPAQSCLIETIAGGGRSFSGDGGPALEAEFDGLTDAVAASDGTIFAADSRNSRIRRITPDGIVATLAGPQDGLVEPTRLAIAPAGAVLAYDGGARRIWRVSAAGAVEQLLDLRLDRTAHLGEDLGLAAAADGAVYIAAPETNRVWRLGAKGELTPFAGTGGPGDAENNGDGGPAAMATLNEPRDVDVGPDGVYVAETGAARVRRVTSDGTITTATNLLSPTIQSGLGSLLLFGSSRPTRIAYGNGFLDVLVEPWAGGYSSIERISGIASTQSTGVVYAAGEARIYRSLGDGRFQPLTRGSGNAARSVASLPDGRALYVDIENRILATPSSEQPMEFEDVLRGFLGGPESDHIAGAGLKGAAGDGGPAQQARLFEPTAVVARRSGEIFIADGTRLRWIDRSGVIRSLPGDLPNARLAIDPKDNVYIATDEKMFRMRSSGLMEQVAQLDRCERSEDCGDGGPVRNAKFFGFSDISAGSDGTLYVLDRDERPLYPTVIQPVPIGLTAEKEQLLVIDNGGFDQRLRSISPQGQIGTAIPEEQLFSNNPTIGPDASGGILLSSSVQGNLLRVSGTTRTVVPGSAGFVYSLWSGGPSAFVGGPDQEVYFSRDNTVRRISEDGHINTIAGRADAPGHSGDGGRAEDALLDQPASLALTADGDLLIADASAGTVRIIRDPAGCDSTLRPQIRLDGIAHSGSGGADGSVYASFLLGRPWNVIPSSRFTPVGTTFAPGSLITIRGVRLGPASPAEVDLATTDRLPLELGGVSVEINGRPAPLLRAGEDRIEAAVPAQAPTEGTAYLRVIIHDVASDAYPLAMQSAAPNVLAVFNGDGSANEAMAPASAGGEIIVLVSGLGLDADATAVAQQQRTMPAEAVSARLYRGGQTQSLEILSVSTWPGFPESVAAVRLRLPDALEADSFSGFIDAHGASASFYVRVDSLR